MIPRSTRSSLPAVLVLAVSVLFAACEKTPFLAPTGSSITLTSATTALPINGTATITAQVLESAGTPPHSGTRVTFTTTLGTIDPAEASTDASGRATVTFRAGSASGTAVIAANSGGATTSTTTSTSSGSSSSTSDRNLRIAVGAAAVGRIVVGASPSLISAQGGNSTITAAVTDVNGNALSGVPVIFTTTAGTLSASSVVTDGAGISATVLQTSVDATVTASAGIGAGTGSGSSSGGSSSGGSTSTGSASSSVTVKVNPVPTLAVKTETTGTLTAGSPITFSVTSAIPSGGTSQIREVTVDFGDGSGITSLGPLNGTSNVQHVYPDVGSARSYTIKATLTDSLGYSTSASTVIVVLPQPPLSVTISASSSTAGTTVAYTFTATVTPSTAVVSSYLWNFGDGSSPQLTTGPQTTKTYAAGSGFKTVSVTVTTTTGQTATSSIVINP